MFATACKHCVAPSVLYKAGCRKGALGHASSVPNIRHYNMAARSPGGGAAPKLASSELVVGLILVLLAAALALAAATAAALAIVL